jgi:hypothetical protein
MKGIMQSSLIAMAVAGIGFISAPMANADECCSKKMSVGPGVTEYRTSETLIPMTTTQSVVVERPVMLENRIIEKQVIKERVPVYITRKVAFKPAKHYRSHRVAHVKYAKPRVISSNTTIERTVEKPIVVERPVVIERNRMIERPVYTDRIIEKPVVIERRVVSRPVVIQKEISRPVIMERRVIEQPVLIEKHKRHLLNLHIL